MVKIRDDGVFVIKIKKALIYKAFSKVGVARLQPPNANLYISVSYKNKFQRVHLSVLNLFKLV